MLFSLLLVTALAGVPVQDVVIQPLPTFADAVQMADAGLNAEALAAFQRLVSSNPNDHAARVWIGRLHERMRNPELAEAVYRSIVLEDPTNLDALLGLASSLLAQNAPREAIEVLDRAEALAPQNDTVLDMLGRAHRQAGSAEAAAVYFERAAALSPSEQHVLSLESARRSYLHWFEIGGFTEQYNGTTPDTRNVDAAANVRLNDRFRVFGRGEVQRKFGVREERGGGGLEWRWTRRTSLRGHVLLGPDALVMPEGDVLGQLEHNDGRATWTAAYRYFNFEGARVNVFAPAVAWPLTNRLDLAVRYALSLTDSNRVATGETGHSLHASGAFQWRRRLAFLAGYAAGVDDFEHFSSDRIGDFRANTVSGGARYVLPSLTALTGRYEWQARRGDIKMSRVTLSVTQSFERFGF
jgi:tetratricopeptide (TPR) repeat protein